VHVGFVLVEKLLVSVDENPWATHGKPTDWFGWKYLFYFPALSRILGRFCSHRSAAPPPLDLAFPTSVLQLIQVSTEAPRCILLPGCFKSRVLNSFSRSLRIYGNHRMDMVQSYHHSKKHVRINHGHGLNQIIIIVENFPTT